ncbi:hypothetical protein BVY04_03025 [bacterium M21]|nr:hypothetical protein BVY04_03025 [bacterium M21]
MTNIKLSTKLVSLFLAIGLIPVTIVAIILLLTASQDMKDQKKVTFGTLTAVRDIKKAQLETYFSERRGDMDVLMNTVSTLRKEAFSKLAAVQGLKKNELERYFKGLGNNVHALKDNPTSQTALAQFEAAVEKGGISSEEWKGVEAQYGPVFADLQKDMGYYDIFLIAKDGDVVYTVAKESDLGQNLLTGSLKESGLARAFRGALGNELSFDDFAPYAPSNGDPAAFWAGPVKDASGQVQGAVAIQIPLNQINEIMMDRTGMGETGESYLVGPDQLMRSDSYLDPKHHTVKASFANPVKGKVDTRATELALAGKEGADVIIDYNGNPVLSVFSPVEIMGIQWAVIAEIDLAEALCPKDEDGTYYFEKYTKAYGYYDLFLLDSTGYCFYTVAHESDERTNLVSGKFKNSGLGVLTRRVMEKKSYGFQDFSPYAPSNNEPAAFIAEPVIHDGNVEMIVALQLPLGAINQIMGVRSGMGQTGESYLVGPDKRMRSDSFLDKEGRSVKASFAGTVENNGCNTEASIAALSGTTEAKIIEDYNGNSVLSSYAPIKVGETTWALISEVDEAEAYAGLKTLELTIVAIGAGCLVLILTIALLFSRSITKPIHAIIGTMRNGAVQVASASQQVAQSSQQMAEGANEQASSLEEVSASIEEMASMTQQNADNAKEANMKSEQVATAAEDGGAAMERMAVAIQDIKGSSDETAKIIKTIDEIAFQTNLLALNAAVEAARAGEAGKGFAVVAEEVRNLAQRSAEAAKNTADLIEQSQQNAENGVAVAQDATKAFSEIADGLEAVGTLVAEVSTASDEQARGIDQVNTGVAQMNTVTQSNAANAEESASASEELSAQSKELEDAVESLVQLVGGNSGSAQRTSERQAASNHAISVPPISGNGKKRALHSTTEKTRKAEAVIPLSDSDFSDF